MWKKNSVYENTKDPKIEETEEKIANVQVK